MNFGQGHRLAVWRPSLELSFLTQPFNQVQSHFLIYTTLIYPAKGYHVLFLAHPSCENIMPLHNTLPRYSIVPCHLFSVDAFQPRLPYNWQPTCAKLLGTTSHHSVSSVSGRHLGRARRTVHSTKLWQSQLGWSFSSTPWLQCLALALTKAKS